MVNFSNGAGPAPRTSPLSDSPFDQETFKLDQVTSRLSDFVSDLRRCACTAEVERIDGSAAIKVISSSRAARAVRAPSSKARFRRMVRMNCFRRWSIKGDPLCLNNNNIMREDCQLIPPLVTKLPEAEKQELKTCFTRRRTKTVCDL